ncbi:MAG TPA: choice-of-anchor tandem repeat GloVer-containing protein [Chthonomonadaceae bacterium]|nr:choice-of-anchor tandem repeat GloVer-containing protein [Chthonomonadaceae bacterium]
MHRSFLFLSVFCLALGLASVRPAQAQLTDTVIHSFNAFSDGENPYTTLTQASDGSYYGTTLYGGVNNAGTVFKVDATGHLTTLRDFSGSDGYYPYGRLTQGSDGMLYGTTQQGGQYGYGTVYKISTDGSVFSTIHSLYYYTDGYYPQAGVIQGSDGMLYGTALYGGPNGYGTVFQLSTDGTVFNVIHSFSYSTDGAYLYGGVAQGSDGMLYGTTQQGGPNGYGTVYQVSTDGTVFNVIHSFSYSTDGYYPSGTLIQGTDGMLYGTADYGGPNGYGTVFQISKDGTTFNVVHGFNYSDGYYPWSGVTQGSDGKLYGTTVNGGSNGYGVVFQVSTDGTIFNDLHSFNPSTDGYNPYGGAILGSDGLVHGTTYYSHSGSAVNFGTLYTVDTAGSTYTTVFDFANGFHDGQYPEYGSLALGKDGNYYGTTYSGGLFNYGVLYKMTPAGKVTILHPFGYSDGAGPEGSVTFDSKGNIYGTTWYGGSNGSGTLFEYSPSTNTFTNLYSFSGTGGADLTGGVVISGTSLYGTTYYGGQHGYGIVFRLNLPSATKPLTFQVLHSFSYADGANPFGNLVLGSDKNLYGTTVLGGTNGYGTVFKISPSSGTLTTIHNFTYSDGYEPIGSLIQGVDGMLYGTTQYGGSNGAGTVFKISKDGSVFNSLHSFVYSDGYYPQGALLQASDHMLYGTGLYGGANGNGTVFQISTDGSVFNVIYSFGSYNTDGIYPYDGLTEGPDGNLYGTTYQGGANTNGNRGTAYMLGTQLPVIKSVSPSSGSVSSGTIVGIKGVNLTGATVTIDGVAQTVQSGATSTSLKFKLNAATPQGTWPVVVTTAHGVGYSPKNFTVGP